MGKGHGKPASAAGERHDECYVPSLPLLFPHPRPIPTPSLTLLTPGTALPWSLVSLASSLPIPLTSSLALDQNPSDSPPCYALTLIPPTVLPSSEPSVLTTTILSCTFRHTPTSLTLILLSIIASAVKPSVLRTTLMVVITGLSSYLLTFILSSLSPWISY